MRGKGEKCPFSFGMGSWEIEFGFGGLLGRGKEGKKGVLGIIFLGMQERGMGMVVCYGFFFF